MRGYNRRKSPQRISAFSDPDGVFNANTSETEKALYFALKRAGIDFEYQFRVNLSPVSVHKNKKVLLLSDRGAAQVFMTVDFVFEINGFKIYLDAKGVEESTDPVSRLKYNLLKHILIAEGQAEKCCIKFIYAKQVKSLARIASQRDIFVDMLLKFANF